MPRTDFPCLLPAFLATHRLYRWDSQAFRCQHIWGGGQGCILRAEESTMERSRCTPALNKVAQSRKKKPKDKSLEKGPMP